MSLMGSIIHLHMNLGCYVIDLQLIKLHSYFPREITKMCETWTLIIFNQSQAKYQIIATPKVEIF